MWFEEIKKILLREDENFIQLSEEHQRLDHELTALAERKFLSPENQLLEVELKKKKLAIKDKMLDIATQYRKRQQASKE